MIEQVFRYRKLVYKTKFLEQTCIELQRVYD